jgi:signal transduction histidine kinase
VEALTAATRDVARGDLTPRSLPRTSDEIGVLADTFETMVERLRESREQLEEFHRRELEHAGRLATVGELAAGVAHEVRNPLAGIDGAVEMLKADLQHLDGKGEILDEVQNQIRRMSKLTTDLLAFASPRRLEPTRYCIHKAIDEALSLMESGRTGAPITFRRRFADDVTAVWIDPQQMHQVLLNLLLNASQAMPEGGEVEIRTRVHDNGDASRRVVIEIRDHGPGVPDEIRDDVLRPFFTTKAKGTGLGLSISRQIVESHGGLLCIGNAPGGDGAMAVVDLPEARPEPAPGPTATA